MRRFRNFKFHVCVLPVLYNYKSIVDMPKDSSGNNIAPNTFINKAIQYIGKEEIRKKINDNIIDPLMDHIMKRVFPYIILTCVLFILLLLVVLLTLGITIFHLRNPNILPDTS